jgi:pyruvate/2-oxoglutarate dehydrogenase complex dihydrolipoamide dehydrogenase (E3) component
MSPPPQPSKHYDVIIIGAGHNRLVAAAREWSLPLSFSNAKKTHEQDSGGIVRTST